ncbi:MAG: alanine--tRNA ligase [Ignisphaera sp.]|uniref:Alanine--tRNA ligase n=1 Tax=Ignisphaera aggregans TaxID=334771 RepID=A0A7C4JKB0_9CREN
MSVVDPSIFRVNIFVGRGYRRQQCTQCNAFFWSIVDRDNCGDVPCTDYTFLKIPAKRKLSYREVRDLFLDFFRRNGHEVVEPRPVVARWREDLYLTIASIVVFQPHVTSGLVPPPANPLVIAQPCVRLEDIDSVGLTLGRHLTNFIMGGHHAFNYRDKNVYWTNETVEYAYKFFVEELGVPEEEITFKESWWEGGGNAGPCFEVAVGGLELATLVFMMYRSFDGKYEELPIKIVDTGYGIERIAWFTQKTPTAFHAVYGSLLSEFHKLIGVLEPREELLLTALQGMPRIKTGGRTSLFSYVANSLGVNIKEVEEELSKVFDLYAILDHTKTAMMMLADGVVPSNSGEGYLARLVIRRTIRRLHRLNREVKLVDLIARQINFWGDMYPQAYRGRDRILEMIELEDERYRTLLSRVSAIASRFSSKQPSVEDLVEVYDAHGIPPEILAEEIEKRYSKKVEVPEYFYSVVASKHSRPKALKTVEEVELPREVVEWASRSPSTQQLFHLDQYVRRFEAKVLGIHGNYIILDRTAFYPQGGGQLGDRGYLHIDGRSIRVVDTKKVGDVVVHVAESSEGLEVGDIVEGEIDWRTRYKKMRHHTATHILLGALRRILGEHVWQAGAEKTEYKARLDITHYKMPSEEEIRKIEELANSIIDNAINVEVHLLPRNEAEKKYGFTLYQGGVPMTPTIRVVEIPGWDAQACFGTHVRNTSEVGAIKIVNVEKIADGIVRFEFVVATALPQHIYQLEGKLKVVAESISSTPAEVDKRITSFVKDLNSIRNTVKAYRSMYVNEVIRNLGHKIERIDSTFLYIHKMEVDDKETLKDIILKAIEQYPNLVFVGLIPIQDKTYVEISLGRELSQRIDARKIVEELSKTLPIKAGGKKDHVTGIAHTNIKDIETELPNKIRFILEKVEQN